MWQNCGGPCGMHITCNCCNVQFSCVCSLHIHFSNEKGVLKYLIDTELCTADIFLQKSLEYKEISIENNKEKIEANSQHKDNDLFSSSNIIGSDNVSNKAVHNVHLQNQDKPVSNRDLFEKAQPFTPNEVQQTVYTEISVNSNISEAVFNSGWTTPADESVTGLLIAEDISYNDSHDVQTTEKETELPKQIRGPVGSSNVQVPCDICGYLYTRRNLKRHIQSHASTKDYRCEICHKVFRTESSLHCHKLHHKVERVNLCHFCGKLFNNGPNLRQHMKSHTRGRTLKCPLCQKTFRSNYVLKDHLSRHSDERPHTCRVCNRSFRKSPELKRHMIAHSEARNHTCRICKKTFKSKSNRIKHEKIHFKTECDTNHFTSTASVNESKL